MLFTGCRSKDSPDSYGIAKSTSRLEFDTFCLGFCKLRFGRKEMATQPATTISPVSISPYTLERANRTRLMIENFYAQALAQCLDRDNRIRKLEEKMTAEGSNRLCNFLVNLQGLKFRL